MDSFAKKPSPAKRKHGNGDGRDSNDTPKKAARLSKEPAAKKEPATKKASAIKKETAVKKEPTPRKEPAVKKEPKVKKETAARSKVKKEEHNDPNDRTILMSGMYDITSATVSETWNEYDLELGLFSDHNRGVWWATFNWGAWDGIMRIQPSSEFNLFGSCELSWRMRDLESGQLTFGRKCTGDIEFFADQTLRGYLFDVPGAGAVDFEGTRVPGPAVQNDLQDEWDDFVKQAYGR